MGWYQEFSDEHHPASLAHHYVAYRAMVRSKVAFLRYQQGDEASANLATNYFNLALHHLEKTRIRLIMVGGGSGVGKSTLARGIADNFGYPVLATDEIRKSLFGGSPDEHHFAAPGEGIYDEASVDKTYEELLREAELVVASGSGVVLDASWSLNAHRELAREVATRQGVEMVEVEAVLEPAIAKERIVRRLSNIWNPSDATPEVVDYQAARRDPWPTAVVVSTEPAPDVVCHRVLEQISSIESPSEK